VDFADYPNVERWYVAIAKRPAVQRGWDLLQEGRVMPMP
jgi:GST-like protein